jgi:acyl-[acyl-carrier-protein]-phospholipid O-acyltransferase/long-chain-fatty-acid--[acyl-carrier-protein] ligase
LGKAEMSAIVTSAFSVSETEKPLPPLPKHWLSLGHAFIHQVKTRPHALAMVDSTGINLTYQQTFERAVALANLIRDDIGACSSNVGILMPPSCGAAIANLALTFLGRIPVNLNYMASKKEFESYINQARIQHVLTSEKVLSKFKFETTAAFLPVEVLQNKLTFTLKALSWIEAAAMPTELLGTIFPGLDPHQTHPSTGDKIYRNLLDEVATVIYTAGSTAEPKGVLLTHRNILSNIQAIQLKAGIMDKEVVLGVMPFFHSFGFTLTLWAVLALGHTAVYHFNPLDGRTVGSLCLSHAASILFCTPTIMRSYLKRCSHEEFKSLKLCILGGEELKPQLAKDLQEKLGITVLAGYGLTETAPVIACNVPGIIKLADGRLVAGNRPGTVGTVLPGTEVRIMSDTSDELAAGQEGMIFVRGPQVMKGYLHNPHETEKVLQNGWFRTGDVGYRDADGFITITGRLTQFAKIGGEMVSLPRIEQEILRIIKKDEQCLSVTSVPDCSRGERLVVVYTDLGMPLSELIQRLKEAEISRLWIPVVQDFVPVDALPVLGNGKLDLRKIKDMAELAKPVNSVRHMGISSDFPFDL